jgi:hypothetical protein
MKRSHGLLATVAFVLACSDATEPSSQTLVLSFQGLEPLANGYHYEGWALVGSEALPTGKFNVSANGGLVTVAGAPIPGGEFRTGRDLSDATAIVLTIEPSGDTDAIPTSTHILAGPVSGGTASLTVGAPMALGSNFTGATGSFILATPTDAANDNERSGIWFLSLAGGAPSASLSLPALPAGWLYEGWAVINGRPLTTGRFTSASGADRAAPFSGPLAAPPFPGEDYLVNAPAGLVFPTDLRGGMAVISIEPEPDDSPAPFTFKPLVLAIPATAVEHTSLTLGNNAAGFPTGTASIR